MAQRDPFAGTRESLAQAARTAASHPLRSALGALAMAAGVATVATVLIALDGLGEYARVTTARTFGADTFVLAQIGSPGSLGRRELQDKLERNPPIRRADLRFLERWAGDAVLLAPSAQRSGEAVAGGHRFENAAITGTSEALERDPRPRRGTGALPVPRRRGPRRAGRGDRRRRGGSALSGERPARARAAPRRPALRGGRAAGPARHGRRGVARPLRVDPAAGVRARLRCARGAAGVRPRARRPRHRPRRGPARARRCAHDAGCGPACATRSIC